MSWGLTYPQTPSEGLPVLTLVSSSALDTSSLRTTIRLQSLQAWQYFFYDIQGRPIGSCLTPDGTGVKVAAYNIVAAAPYITYPTYVTISIVDTASWKLFNSVRMQLIGADVFNVTLVWPPKIPLSNGYINFAVDGEHYTGTPEEMNQFIWSGGDVHIESNI